MHKTLFLTVTLVLLVPASLSWSEPRQETTQTTLAGVYTSAQVERGKVAYDAHCASCHRDDLSGFSGPPLIGDRFLDRWREFDLSVMYNAIVATMPRNAGRTLKEQEYLDIQALILQANGLPAGQTELSAGVMPNILLVGPDGPKPLPSSSPVDVVGCLAENLGSGWFLVRASEPARTLDQWEITREEMGRSVRKPLGELRFRLQDIADVENFDPNALVGRKVQVKGVLVRQPGNERVNVTAAQMIGSCP